VVIFKALVPQTLSNLSDDQAEYQLRDRLSFMRFLGLGLEDAVPDAKTLWLYREALAKAAAVEELFDLFDRFLKDKGYLAMASASSKRFSPEGKKDKARRARGRTDHRRNDRVGAQAAQF
jgi:IS5 family transposase